MNEEASSDRQPEAPVKRRPYIRIAAVAVLGVVVLILVLQNTETVETKLLFTTVSMPRAVLLFTTFLGGVAVGVLAAFLRKRKTKT